MLLQACSTLVTEVDGITEEESSVPNTEIYLAEISFPDNKFTLSKAKNITQKPGLR